MNGAKIAAVVAAAAGIALTTWGITQFTGFGGRAYRSAGATLESPQAAPPADRPGPAEAGEEGESERVVGVSLGGPGGPGGPSGPRTLDPEMGARLAEVLSLTDLTAEYTFPERDRFDFAAAVRALEDRARGQLATMPPAKRQALVNAWASLIGPILDADRDALASALAGVAGSGRGSPPPADLLEPAATVLAGATFDPEAARFLAPLPMRVPRMPKIPGMSWAPDENQSIILKNINVTTNPDGTERHDIVTIMPLAPQLGLGDGVEQAEQIETWVPFLLAGSRDQSADLGLGLFFAYDPSAAAWKPIGVRLEAVDDDIDNLITEAGRSARQRQGDDQ